MDNDPAAAPLLRHPDPIIITTTRAPAPGPAHAAVPAPPSPPLSGIQRFAIAAFSVLRIIRGLCFIAYPALSADSLDMPADEGPNAAFILGSLLGVRDLLLGGLLYTADEGLEREVRRALVVNLLSDAMDTFILIFAAACSARWEHHIASIVAVAALALLEHLTLFSMGDDEELEMRMVVARESHGIPYHHGGYSTMLQAHEDKKMRLESWLTELRYAEHEVLSQSAVVVHPPERIV